MFFIDTFDQDIVQAVIKDGGTRAERATNYPPAMEAIIPQEYYYGAPGWRVHFEIVPHWQSTVAASPNYGRTLIRLEDSEATALSGRSVALSDPSRLVNFPPAIFLTSEPADFFPPMP